jgi:hypothetical protein
MVYRSREDSSSLSSNKGDLPNIHKIIGPRSPFFIAKKLTNRTKHNTLIAIGGNMNDRPTAHELLRDLVRWAVGNVCRREIKTIAHKNGYYPLVRIFDEEYGLDNGIFLLTAGIHGTEIAGPLTIHRYFDKILELTRAAGLKLVCYPLMNPSGYDNGTDRNPDNPDLSNNDYLRYQGFDGTLTWKMTKGDPYKQWLWSSDPLVNQRLPAETMVMHEYLKREDWPNIKVALDIHQDYLSPDLPAGAYHYPFNDVSRYTDIIEQIRGLTTVLGNHKFGYDRNDPNAFILSDKDGCIPYFHDGSMSDLAHRLNVPDALTIETTGKTPLETAIEINMTWIRELCKLAGH